MRKIRIHRGFTLVELLVVISIIAMLLAILMPSLQKARESARRIVCAENVRQQGLGMKAYAVEHNNKYPYAPLPGWWPFGGLANWDISQYGTNCPLSLGTFVPASQIALNVGKYIMDPKVFYCPSTEVKSSSAYKLLKEYSWDPQAKQYSTPTLLGRRCQNTYVGYLTWAGYGYDTTGTFYGRTWGDDEEKMNRFQRKATKDCMSRGDAVSLTDLFVENTGTKAYLLNNHNDRNKPGGGNIHFNDGSTKWVHYSDTETMLEIPSYSLNFRF